jgi:glycerophosphoryl diester phosphodiesterase
MRINPVNDIVIAAHRGASYAAPENTIPAFQLAFKEKADFIEGDFRLTKDNEIVCIHDPDTKRVTGNKTKIKVRSSTLAGLKKLDVGLWKGSEYKGTSIPTLQEVLQIIPDGKGIYIEIKDYSELFLKKLVEIIKQFSIPYDKIRIITFNSMSVQSAKKNLPGIKVYRLFGYRFSQKKYFKVILQRWLIHMLPKIGSDGVDSIAAPFIDEKLVKHIRDSDLDFCVYDVENIGDAVRFVKLGVDSITTNSPLKIRNAIIEYLSNH